MRRKAPRRKAPPAPEAPGAPDPEETDSGTVWDDGGGQRTEVELPYHYGRYIEVNLRRPISRGTPCPPGAS